MLSAFAGGQFFGSRSGTGLPAVLALHGWRRTHRDFDAVVGQGDSLDALDAVALDLPGFGATPPPSEAWGSAQYAAAVAQVVEEMAVPVVVLGHSFGGGVALALAASRPDLVRALVLTGVPRLVAAGGTKRANPRFRFLRGLHRVGLMSDQRMEEARRRYGSPDYRAATGVMRQVFVTLVQEHHEERLAALRCPVSLVWGALDAEVPLAVAREAQALIADVELTVLPGVGHLTPTQAPEALRAALERVLARAP